MKLITTTIAALLLATNADAETCQSATQTTQDLLEDLRISVQPVEDADLGSVTDAEAELMTKSVMRRVLSVQSSLIAVNVYCGGNSASIAWANSVEDMTDRMIEALR
ncbi:MAG: hypothetical protein ACOC0Q_07380 [Wenzhouxiangella sp.]